MSELTVDFVWFFLIALGPWPFIYFSERRRQKPISRQVRDARAGSAGAGVVPWSTEQPLRPLPIAFPARAPRARIESLSAEQARRLSDWLAAWSRHGASSATTDRHAVEDKIARLYGDPGTRRLRFKWVHSPWSAWVAGMRDRETPNDEGDFPSTRSSLDRVCRELLQQLHWQVEWTLTERIRNGLGRTGAGRQDLQVIMNTSVFSWGASNERPVFRLATMDGTSSRFDPRTAFLTCCRDVLGLAYDDVASAGLDLFMRTAGCFGWWRPHENVCVVSEGPTVMHRDDRGRLHHPTSAAVRFRDGFSAHAWHGTRVPGNWLEAPEQLRPAEVLTWSNADLRRAALEIMGWKRVLEHLHPRTVDTDADPAIGQLLEVDLPQSGRARFLRVRCGTGRDFVLAVPQQMRTALEANAWTYDLSPAEYKLEERT
jgi:hypothetical protein